jgi:hypothetical protein
LKIAIAERSGWLVADIVEAGWAQALAAPQRQALQNAIAGLYKTAGIRLVRQQLEREFPPPMPACDLSGERLVLWPDEATDAEVIYDLKEGPWIAPQSVRGRPPRLMPTIERRRILFQEMPITWEQWIAVWSPASPAQGLGIDVF